MAIKRNARYRDLTVTDPQLAAEWDYSRNGSLTPEDVTRGSEEKTWWVCEEGHHYEAAVFSRKAYFRLRRAILRCMEPWRYSKNSHDVRSSHDILA